MANRVETKTVNLGRLPVYCDAFNRGSSYHKYNIVTFLGSTFINLVEGNTKEPVKYTTDASSRLVNYSFTDNNGEWTGWTFIANTFDASIYAKEAGDYAISEIPQIRSDLNALDEQINTRVDASLGELQTQIDAIIGGKSSINFIAVLNGGVTATTIWHANYKGNQDYTVRLEASITSSKRSNSDYITIHRGSTQLKRVDGTGNISSFTDPISNTTTNPVSSITYAANANNLGVQLAGKTFTVTSVYPIYAFVDPTYDNHDNSFYERNIINKGSKSPAGKQIFTVTVDGSKIYYMIPNDYSQIQSAKNENNNDYNMKRVTQKTMWQKSYYIWESPNTYPSGTKLTVIVT